MTGTVSDDVNSVCLGLFLSYIDTSIVATSLFSIGSEFDDLERVNWVAISYTLAYMGCAVVFARISDVIGRRDAFIAAYIVFFAFSIGCGFAQNCKSRPSPPLSVSMAPYPALPMEQNKIPLQLHYDAALTS